MSKQTSADMYLFIIYMNMIQWQLFGSLSVEPFTLDLESLLIVITPCDVG